MNQLEKLLWNNHKEIFTREKVIPKIKLKDHPDGDKKIIDINKEKGGIRK